MLQWEWETSVSKLIDDECYVSWKLGSFVVGTFCCRRDFGVLFWEFWKTFCKLVLVEEDQVLRENEKEEDEFIGKIVERCINLFLKCIRWGFFRFILFNCFDLVMNQTKLVSRRGARLLGNGVTDASTFGGQQSCLGAITYCLKSMYLICNTPNF